MMPWLLAIRPKTLPAGISPVMIGLALAFGDGSFHFPSALACLLAALLIQIGTNLANDYFDFKKGADANRAGPTRVSQAGLIEPNDVLKAACISFFLAALMSIYLIMRAGPVIAIIAVISIISGFWYTAGKRALAYIGLGELFVLVFFGPVAVAGTYYVQTMDMNLAVLAAGLGPGLISCAILAVNNLRDIEGDAKVNKRTLAVRFGRDFARREYAVLMFAASICPLLVYMITGDHIGILSACLIIIPTLSTIQTVSKSVDASELNRSLAMTGAWLLIYSLLFSIGWVLWSR